MSAKLIRAGWLCLLLASASVGRVFAAEAARTPLDVNKLAQMSLEDLMNVQVISVSKKSESLAKSSAAITVLNGDELRRSATTLLPDVFRTVPGMDVARVNAHSWAISARGFNETFANKLLVMIDGRTVYTPLFSGVFWEVQDVLLDDLDRIEVIRGPGASLWGANAVNGVINILSKSSADTQGTVIQTGGGTDLLALGSVRYGGRLSDHATYRVYAKYQSVGDSKLLGGGSAFDRFQIGRGGFRTDHDLANNVKFTLQGDFYEGRERTAVFLTVPTPPFVKNFPDYDTLRGANLLGRWTKNYSDKSSLQFQAYYDYTLRAGKTFNEVRHTVDLDVQHRFGLADWNDIVIGGGYRLLADDLTASLHPSYKVGKRDSQLFSLFLQDEIKIVPDRLSLTLGTRLEHNDFTQFEVQPNARFLWTPAKRHEVWGAVARAVRTPSRNEHDLSITQPLPQPTIVPYPPGTALKFTGNPNFESGVTTSFDLGYRWQPADRLTLDFAGYYYQSDGLRTIETGTPVVVPPLTIPATSGNFLEARTLGFEAGPQFQVAENWRLRLSYSYSRIHSHVKLPSKDIISAPTTEGLSPQQQVSLVSMVSLPRGVDVTSTLRYVDRLPFIKAPAYFEVDLRLGWKVSKQLEFAVVGQNLLDDHHPEFASTAFVGRTTEVSRSVFASMTWRF